ncbi:MAG: peptidoglycan-binding protein, partial [Clostridia bacterium]|nr:peptidoglycan-binding protein [Clostridia bacterium]
TLAATDHSAGERTHTCVDCGKTEKESFDPEGTLRRKDKGGEVREMQELLVDAGVMKPKQVNGSFNSATEKAVKQFQKQKGLTADGVAWPQTRNLLRHEWSDWVVVLEPTDFSAGKKARTCSICGMPKEEEFDPEGTLRQGDEGESVRAMQIALKEKGIFKKNTTGSFGPNTVAAVKKFQKQQGLTQDGIGWPGVLKLLGISVQETPAESPLPVAAESEKEEEPEEETAFASMEVLCDVISVPKAGDVYTEGDTIIWRLLAINRASTKVSTVVLTDSDQKTPLSDLMTELEPGNTVEAQYTHEVNATDVEMGSVSWFGYAKYMSADGQMVLTASPVAKVTIDGLRTAAGEPEFGGGASISLYSNGSGLPESGIGDEAEEAIGLKVVVEAGDEPLDNVEISLLSGGPVAVIDHLDAGETETFDLSHPLSDFEKGEGGIIDQAIMKFTGPHGKKGIVKSGMFKKSWKDFLNIIIGLLEAEKTKGLVGSIEVVNGPAHGGDAFLDGEKITFTVTIRNESDHPFYKVSGYFSQTARATEKRNYGTLNPGNEVTETYTRDVDGENIPDGHITADFNIKAEYPEGESLSVNGGSVTVECDIQNKYDMTVLLNPPVAKAEYHEDDEVNYQIYVANETEITFTDVTVSSLQMGKLMHREEAAPAYSQMLNVTHLVTEADLKQGFFNEQITLTCLGENNEERTVSTELITILTPGKTNEDLAESGLGLCSVAMILKDTGEPANKEAYQEGEKVYLDLELVNTDSVSYEKAKVRIGTTGDWIPYPGGTIKSGADQHLQETHVITKEEADEGSISIGAFLMFWKEGQWYLCKAHPITLKTGTGETAKKTPKSPGKHKPGHHWFIDVIHDSDPEGTESTSDSPEQPEGSEEGAEKEAQAPMEIKVVVESEPANKKYYTLGEEVSYTVTIKNGTDDLFQNIYLHEPGMIYSFQSVLWANASSTFGPYSHEITEDDLQKNVWPLDVSADYVDAAETALKVKAPTVYVKIGKDPEKTEEEKSGLALKIKVTNKPKTFKGFRYNETIHYDVIATNQSSQNVYVKISSLGTTSGLMLLKSGAHKTLHASHKVTLKEAIEGHCELTADMHVSKKKFHFAPEKVTADPVKVKTWLKGFHKPGKEEKTDETKKEEGKEEKKEDTKKEDEKKKPGDDDKGIIVATGKEDEDPEGGAKQKDRNTKWKPVKSETPRTETPTVPAGDCCERVLVSAGDGSLTYEVHLCSRHAAVAESISRMISAAVTDEEKASVWKKAAGLWSEEIAMQYETAAMNATDPAAKEKIREAAAAFSRMSQALEADLDNLHQEQPEQAGRIMADMLKDHCVDLCIEIHTVPAARKDSLTGTGFTELTGSLSGETVIISETGNADGSIQRKIQLDSDMGAILRNIHSLIRQVKVHPGTYTATTAPTPLAQVLQTAQDHWRKEIDQIVTARYISTTDPDELQALMASRNALLTWLDARKNMVNLLYPSIPEAAEEAAAKEAMKWLMYVRNPEIR